MGMEMCYSDEIVFRLCNSLAHSHPIFAASKHKNNTIMEKNNRKPGKQSVRRMTRLANYRRKPKLSNYHVITSLEVPLSKTGLIYATFTCKGKKMNFLIDTGSNISYVESSAISGMDLELKQCNESAKGITGHQEIGFYCSMVLETPTTVTVIDLPISDFHDAFASVEEECGVKLHGLLGNNFLQASKYVIDYDKMMVLKPKSRRPDCH